VISEFRTRLEAYIRLGIVRTSVVDVNGSSIIGASGVKYSVSINSVMSISSSDTPWVGCICVLYVGLSSCNGSIGLLVTLIVVPVEGDGLSSSIEELNRNGLVPRSRLDD